MTDYIYPGWTDSNLNTKQFSELQQLAPVCYFEDDHRAMLFTSINDWYFQFSKTLRGKELKPLWAAGLITQSEYKAACKINIVPKLRWLMFRIPKKLICGSVTSLVHITITKPQLNNFNQYETSVKCNMIYKLKDSLYAFNNIDQDVTKQCKLSVDSPANRLMRMQIASLIQTLSGRSSWLSEGPPFPDC